MFQENLKDAWAMFPTGVTVLTSTEDGISHHGMTANSVMSLSVDPPLVLISVAESRESHSIIRSTGKFGISVLKIDQSKIAEFYAEDAATKSSLGIHWKMTKLNGVCTISNSLVRMACDVTNSYNEGDHTLFIGMVTALELEKGKPLLWFNRKFGQVQSF